MTYTRLFKIGRFTNCNKLNSCFYLLHLAADYKLQKFHINENCLRSLYFHRSEKKNGIVCFICYWYSLCYFQFCIHFVYFPWAPPWLMGSWQVTNKVWHNCVLPIPDSTKTSTIVPVSIPLPLRNLSTSLDPLVIQTNSFLLSRISAADIKPIGTDSETISSNLSTLLSLNPLISLKM